MWEAKIKLKHDCTIGNRCQKFNCKSHSLTLSNWEENGYFFTSQRHNLIGKTTKVVAFISDLKKDKRIHNLKIFNNDVFFIEKRKEKNIPSSFYRSDLIFVKPVDVDNRGVEEWTLASTSKEKLYNFCQGLKNSTGLNFIELIYVKSKNKINYLDTPYDKNNIIYRLEDFLESKLGLEKISGNIEGEQWFRDFQDWLLIAFNNPYNWKRPNSELSLLEKYEKSIYSYIKEHTLIFYGTGVGETELEIIRQILEKEKRCETVAIDVNPIFINLFKENLKNKCIEYPQSKILFKGYNALFQNLTKDDFNFQNSRYKNNAHICLGGTIGNFKNQEEIFLIFKNNTKIGDTLLLAFQLDNNIEQTFKKYKQNKFFPRFTLNYEDEFNTKQIRWVLDKKKKAIKMYYKDIEVFRSKKYSIKGLASELKKFNFTIKNYWVDDSKNTCLVILKRIGSTASF